MPQPISQRDSRPELFSALRLRRDFSSRRPCLHASPLRKLLVAMLSNGPSQGGSVTGDERYTLYRTQRSSPAGMRPTTIL